MSRLLMEQETDAERQEELLRLIDQAQPSHVPGESPKQRAERIGVPYLPPRVPTKVPNSNKPIAICHCGAEIRKVMGLSCSREDCPVSGPRPTFASR